MQAKNIYPYFILFIFLLSNKLCDFFFNMGGYSYINHAH